MNHVYRIVWNPLTQGWVAVAETAKGRGKTASRKLMAAAILLIGTVAQAGPQDGQVVSGAGSIAQSGNTTTVSQASANLSLTWKSFNVAANEKVIFVQPSASSLAVNRIFDTNGSQILGQLNANGQVYLINPNGIIFGAGAQVNVGALVASTLNLNDASLGSATRSFSGTSTASVVNHGSIQAASGGYVALLGQSVSNQGRISAPMGSVALGAGSTVSLNFNGNSLVDMKVDQSVLGTLVENGGLIQADGGAVLMSAGAKNALLASVVNNTGIIEARTVANHEGRIVLLGGMAAGTVKVGGTLDASAPRGGNGGFIETSAAKVQVADGAIITTAAPQGKTGTWLIDPFDFTVATAGGDITGAALGTLLASNSITIQTADTPAASATQLNGSSGTNGDIFINDAVSWSANSTLTLDAWRNIHINQSITASGANGKLALQYGQGATDGVVGGVTASYSVNAPVNLQAGANFSTQLGSAGTVKNFTVITSLGAENSATKTDLQGMNGDLTLNYALGGNIDASATSGWNTTAGVSAGFEPIGNTAAGFDGAFDGLGHAISGLTIYRPTTNFVGLFSSADTSASIRNLGLLGNDVTGAGNVGALVGVSSATITSSFATGNVAGAGSYVGGLLGYSSNSVSDSYASGTVAGVNVVGGLVGYNSGSVSNSRSEVNVNGTSKVGGLVGYNVFGVITDSYATGRVTGGWSDTGGLVGKNDTGLVIQSYASGSVAGVSNVGGLVGANTNTGGIGYSYAAGSVTGTAAVGGLVGSNAGSVSHSYATSIAMGSSSVGGLVGSNAVAGTLTTSYWNKTKTAVGVGDGSDAGSIGLTATEMQTASNFTSFSFTTTPGKTGKWVLVNGDGSLNTAGSGGGTTPMLASEYSTNIANAHQLQLMAMAPGASYTLAANVNAAATGLIDGVSTDVWGAEGFVPVGNSSSPFTGVFNGQDRAISGLSIDRPTTDYVGLLGSASSAVIRNVGLIDASVTGNAYVGSLAGIFQNGTVADSHASGSVLGTYNWVGGLLGASTGAISTSYANGTVSGAGSVGGLVGSNVGFIRESYATGNVVGTANSVGGLAGFSGGPVISSYATGRVAGVDEVGGLVGTSWYAITGSYATGSVSGGDNLGGLVGASLALIDSSYATGSVSGTASVGGLVGTSIRPISGSYAAGTATGTSDVGGLVGLNADDRSILTGNYWNKTNTTVGVGGAGAVGATGLTAVEMQSAVNFSSFDLTNTWFLYEGLTTPLLRSFMAPLTVTANNFSKTYDGLAYASTPGNAGVTYSTVPSANLLGSVVYGGSAQGAVNAGSYELTAGGLYSNQQGYIISYAAGALTVYKANLQLIGSRVYDGSTTFAGSHLVAVGVNGERFAVTGLGDASNLAIRDVQTDQVLSSVTGLALGNGATAAALAENYYPLIVWESMVSVTPVPQLVATFTSAGDLLAQQMSSRTGMPNLDLPEVTGGRDDFAGLAGPVPVSIAAGGVRLPAARFYP